MTNARADLDYVGVLRRAFDVGTKVDNLLVLFLGAAIVVLGGLFSAFILAGPLGVGYADACGKMARGQKPELDDIFWRGFERFWPSVVAGLITMLAAAALFFALFIPGTLALYFGAVVFCVLAFDPEARSGVEAIQRVWGLVVERPGPLAIMGLILGILGALLSLTVIGSVIMVALVFLTAVFTYAHYFAEDADPRWTQAA
jgi:hypothetical protein